MLHFMNSWPPINAETIWTLYNPNVLRKAWHETKIGGGGVGLVSLHLSPEPREE